MAGLAATEALKLLVGSDRVVRGMTWVDLWENTFERIELPRQPDCPACGRGDYAVLEAPIEDGGTNWCGRNAVQVRPPRGTAGEHNKGPLAEPLGRGPGSARQRP